MPRPIPILAIAIALAAAGNAVFAEDGAVSGSVSITATRMPESPSSVPPAVTVVTAQEIAARGARNAADAVKAVPGVTIQDNGPEGAQKTASIRGSTSNQVLVLVDGVRANDALSGLADLSGIPVEDVERIEVMRGGSALYGGDAVGGVINVITKKKASPLALSLENGSFIPASRVSGFGFSKRAEAADPLDLADSQRLAFSWAPRAGDALLRGAGSVTRARNGYTFIDANGERRERQNAALLGGDASLGLSLPCLGGSLSADLAGAYGVKGIPGSLSVPTLNATERDSTARAAAKYAADRFLADGIDIEAAIHASYSGIDYSDADQPENGAVHRVVVGGLDLQQRWAASSSFSLLYGASAGYTMVASDEVGTPRRSAAGIFVEPIIEAGRFSLRPALRYDYYSDFFLADPLGGLAATLAAAYRLSDSDVLKLNASRAYRVPTFEDLYWPASNGCEGNPNLRPESAYAIDFGYERNSEGLEYRAVAYARYARDVILWQPGPDGIWRPSNYGAALYPGIEQELKVAFGKGYWASANYSFIYSFLLDEGMTLSSDLRVPMVPTHGLNASLGRQGERLSWTVTAKYSGLRYLTEGNVGFLPSYLTLDALVRRAFDKRFSAFAAADNLFGEQYQAVAGYPMPGTRLRAGLEAKF